VVLLKLRKTNNLRKYHAKRAYTKSEKRLYAELLRECIDDIDAAHEIRTQYKIELEESYCVPDIAIPSLKIAIKVNGSVHGISGFPTWSDELQDYYIKKAGWDLITVYEDERPDLWK
jgi:very-short-patch-repair endonuclease